MGTHPYGHRYKKLRAALLGHPCSLQLVCDGDPADSADHSPPLSRHEHHEGSGCCVLLPACMRCQGEQARMLSMETKALKRMGVSLDDLDPGLVQSVEWL
jgi:hypothetical protein